MKKYKVEFEVETNDKDMVGRCDVLFSVRYPDAKDNSNLWHRYIKTIPGTVKSTEVNNERKTEKKIPRCPFPSKLKDGDVICSIEGRCANCFVGK